MLRQRKGVLLDGIGRELVRAERGGRRRALSSWLNGVAESLPNSSGLDQLAPIQAIIDTLSAAGGGVIYAPPGHTYILNGRLTLKNNVDIYLQGSTFQFVGVNDGVDTQSTGLIANGDLSASGIVGFSGPLYKITDSASYYVRTSSKRQGLCNVRLIGRSAANPQGTGLQLRSDTGGAGIAYLRFENVTALYFVAGVHLYQSGSGWINDNVFEQLVISGCTTNHLYLQGNPTNNNKFVNLTIQPNTSLANAVRALECDGDENYFLSTIWDWASSGSTLAVVFSGENNKLVDGSLDPAYVKDKASERLDANLIELRGATKVYKSEGFFTPTDTENPSFDGHDDCLAWAHTLRTVTASGDAGTNPNNLFLPGEAVTSWASLSSATYKIDFGSSQTYLFAAGVTFAFGDIADNVTISYSDDDAVYNTLTSVTGNFNHDVNACGKSFIAGTFRYIKFVISNDAGKATKISRLYAYTPSIRGREFISHDENNLLGTLPSSQWTRVATGGRTGNDDANAQSVFDSATDTIALEANTLYEVRGQYSITRTAGTTSHTTAILFNFTGTANYFLSVVQVTNGNLGTLTAVSQIRMAALTALTITAANTSATENLLIKIEGTLRTTNAGAFTPQFQYSAGPGQTPTIGAGSFFEVKRLGVNTAVSAGPWS